MVGRVMGWMVLRTDDNGNTFLVEDGLDGAGARTLVDAMTARGHKQTCTAYCYKDRDDRASIFAQFRAIT